tara:strand:- start:166 stop:366 length:201 start_codon:yes stop_codon:yes gene_type:complete
MTDWNVPFVWLEDTIRMGDVLRVTDSIGSLMEDELVEVLSISGKRATVESLATKVRQEIPKKLLAN